MASTEGDYSIIHTRETRTPSRAYRLRRCGFPSLLEVLGLIR